MPPPPHPEGRLGRLRQGVGFLLKTEGGWGMWMRRSEQLTPELGKQLGRVGVGRDTICLEAAWRWQ